MPRERSFVSMSFGMLTTGLLLQLLLLLGTKRVAAQEGTFPNPPITSVSTSTITTTITTPKATVTPKASVTPTDSMSCWLAHNRNTSDVCYSCNICKTGPSGGAVAGIVIAVLIVYILSLILVAILVSVLTKRGTLDLSKWRLLRITSNDDDKVRSSNIDTAESNDYTEETHTSPAELYTALETRTREEQPPEPSPYEALRKNRNRKPKIKKKPTTAVPAATDDEIYQNY